MAIFDNVPDVSLTTAKKKEVVNKKIKDMVNNFQNSIIREQGLIHKYVWSNPQGLTTQEVMDGLGADAATVVQMSRDLLTIIATNDPSFEAPVSPNGETLEINGVDNGNANDGTVTVVEAE